MVRLLTPNTLTTTCVELNEALRMADAAVEAAKDAEAAVKSARDALRQAAQRYLMGAETDEERIARASFLYWQMPDVRVADIAAVLLGSENKAHAVATLLPNPGVGAVCEICGARDNFRSRSAMEAHRQCYAAHRAWPYRCAACSASHIAGLARSREDDALAMHARAEELRTMPYREYLLTPEWLATRNQKLKQAWFKCQLCMSGGLLNVHHRTYERRGCEEMADLTVLCHACHQKFHDKLPVAK